MGVASTGQLCWRWVPDASPESPHCTPILLGQRLLSGCPEPPRRCSLATLGATGAPCSTTARVSLWLSQGLWQVLVMHTALPPAQHPHALFRPTDLLVSRPLCPRACSVSQVLSQVCQPCSVPPWPGTLCKGAPCHTDPQPLCTPRMACPWGGRPGDASQAPTSSPCPDQGSCGPQRCCAHSHGQC